MWRQGSTKEDAEFVATVCEASEFRYYGNSQVKGGIEHAINSMTKRFSNSEEEWWLYEDGDKKIVVGLEKRPNELARIERVCAIGFSDDVYENEKLAMPIYAKKIREVMDGWGVKRFWSKAPRTLRGECQAYLAQAYIGEATTKLSPEGTDFIIDYDRDNKDPNEKEFKVIKTPIIDSDAAQGKPLKDFDVEKT